MALTLPLNKIYNLNSLLTNHDESSFDQISAQFLKEFTKEDQFKIVQTPIDLASVETAVSEQLSKFPSSVLYSHATTTLRVPDKAADDKDPQYSEQQALLSSLEQYYTVSNAPAYKRIQHSFVRIVPPIFDPNYIWIDDVDFDDYQPVWDKNMKLKDEPKVEVKESYQYKYPITELLMCLKVNYDFDGSQEKLRQCKTVLANVFFLTGCCDEFIECARQLIFEMFCRIHHY